MDLEDMGSSGLKLQLEMGEVLKRLKLTGGLAAGGGEGSVDLTDVYARIEVIKNNITALNTELATKAPQANLDATNIAVAGKAPQASLDATNAGLGELSNFALIPSGTIQALGNVSGAVTINPASGNLAYFTVTGITTVALSAVTGNNYRVLSLVINGGGNYAVTWPASVIWSDGAAPTLSAGYCMVTLVYIPSLGKWLGLLAGGDFA